MKCQVTRTNSSFCTYKLNTLVGDIDNVIKQHLYINVICLLEDGQENVTSDKPS